MNSRRIRDLKEIWGDAKDGSKAFPVAATRGTSVLGAAGYARAVRVGEPITLCAGTGWPVVVREGDIIVCDIDGAVRVPSERAAEVAQLAQKIRQVDAKCMEAVEKGSSLKEAFQAYRGK